MTPDQPADPPRKTSRKWWILVAAGVLALALIAILVKAPAPQPVSIQLVRSLTNGGHKTLVFQGTNGSLRGISYYACITTNRAVHPKAFADAGPYYAMTYAPVSTSKAFYFTLDAPQDAIDWRVMWVCIFDDRELAPWKRIRTTTSKFFKAHGMPKLARTLQPPLDVHFIPAAEIKE